MSTQLQNSEPTVAIYSGSFNPPVLHHQAVVRELVRHFDRVVVVPPGTRPWDSAPDRVGRVFRAAMADMAFGGIDRLCVELFDLEQSTFTRTHELERRFSPSGKVWHVVGANLIAGGSAGNSFIHRHWADAQNVWRQSFFVVVKRQVEQIAAEDLPSHHQVLVVDEPGSATEVRGRLFRGEVIDDLLCPEVKDYIERHQLYRGSAPPHTTTSKLAVPRLMIVSDDRNPKAQRLRERFAPFGCETDANLILVLGGDGTMLHAIQAHWRRRLPFFGINAGHVGFLMNEADETVTQTFPPSELVLRQMPMIHAEFRLTDGSWRQGLSFNDVWLERHTGQTAWLSLTVNGQNRFGKLIGDGLLLSTAAGSTAYALSMGAMPLLADTPAWLLVGNNVMTPRGWKSALLSLEDEVVVTVLDPEKRPVRGYLYGILIGEVVELRARISKIAAVELGFYPQHDMAHKIAKVQFPSAATEERAA
jgi:nicotinate (nicotinamide) nucleotide adenylyltransferase